MEIPIRIVIHRTKCVYLRRETFSPFLEIGIKHIIEPQKYNILLMQYRECESSTDRIIFFEKLKLLGCLFCLICKEKE